MGGLPRGGGLCVKLGFGVGNLWSLLRGGLSSEGFSRGGPLYQISTFSVIDTYFSPATEVDIPHTVLAHLRIPSHSAKIECDTN